ncbi:restriction endonuclease subunit S [Limosilactobacillus allomucosae]|uniref:Restriction endonuclease subunit S n=1 Tax=Limosilactobacillus allomucosae TaxID=3142938 RepID=A0AAU7C0Q3_9LACO
MTKQNEKDAKRVPELRFKGFTDDWEQRKLGEIGETFSGLSGKNKNDFGHGDASFITYMNVFSNSIADLRGTEHVEIDSKQNQVMYGDILFTTSSETPEEVGMSSVWLGHIKNIYLNSFCFGYRILEKQNFDSYYMAYLLRAENFRKRMTVLAQGISRYNISKKQVMNTFVNFPTMEEQRKIGKALFLIDKTITLHEEKQHQLEQLKKALLQKMFADKTGYPALRFKGFTEKWEQRKPKNYLRESRILGSTGVDAKKLTVKLWGKGVVEKKESISGSNNTRYYIRHAGQLMYGKLDFLHAAFGIVPKELDKYESTADSPAFDIIDGNPKFLLEFFLRKEFYLRNGQRANGSRKAKRIHEKDFLEMPILVPYKSEQTKIGNLINSLDRTITLHDKKIQYLKQLKRGLLQKMFV